MRLFLYVVVTLAAKWTVTTGFFSTNRFGSKGVTNDGVDPGQPLFLTPLIEAGQLEEARQQSKVLPLPGAPAGGVPRSYSGYLTVNKKYNSNLFFWYFPAQVPDPSGVPVLLWLQGGPGASSLFGLFVEHGPVVVTKSLNLEDRPYAWTSQFHMLYVDQPVGTGFSFTDNSEGYVTNEDGVASDLYQGLLQFFTLFPDLQQSDFYVTGESYGGKYVPAISYKLHKEQPEIIRFRGMAIGNGLIDPVNMHDYGHYLYQLGLLDENQSQYFLDKQEIITSYIRQKSWYKAFETFDHLIMAHTLGTSSFNNFTGITQHYNFLKTQTPDDQNYYMDYVVRSSVRRAIHVGNTTYSDGKLVAFYLLNDFMQSTAPLVAELMDHYKVMIYSGQLDVIVAYPLTANFLQNLQWSGSDAYKRADRSIWKVDKADQEVAGYVRQVGEFYQVLVRCAGHMVPYDQSRVAIDMISRFVKGKSFDN